MTRRVLALVVVLIVSGLAPATAVIGFCAKMPCCFGDAHDGPVLATNNADCCTTISCYEAPTHELTVSAKAKTTTATAPAVLAVVAAVPAAPPVASYSFDDTSPPPTTKQRLSALSILLI